MKFIVLAFLLSVASTVDASQLRIESVTLPLYLQGSDTTPRIAFQSVPYVTFGPDPEWRFSAICVPCIPSTSGSLSPRDVNLTSLYRITIDGNYTKTRDLLVTVDASKATQPEGYPFTVDQVIDATVTCIKIMYPSLSPEDGAFSVVITKPNP